MMYSTLFGCLVVAAAAQWQVSGFAPIQQLRHSLLEPDQCHNNAEKFSHRLKTTQLLAKKKKGNNKKKPKQSGFAWAASFTLEPYEAQATRELVSTAVASFQGRTGQPLCEDIAGVTDIPKALWKAPIACVIVDPDDGMVSYANVAALETVGLTADQWKELTVNPSPPATEDEVPPPSLRLDLPSTMKDKTYESGYQKKILRQHSLQDGETHDIGILNAHRWKLEKSALVDGKFATTSLGVAYAWNEWVLDDAIVCAPGGKRREMINVQDLEKAVEEQATMIRDMKEGRGLGNKNPKVQDAVAELLRLKDLLAASQ